MKLATWTSGALAFGWLAAVGSLAFPEGHPPMAYVVGAAVVLASFVIAPIGALAACATVWRARRQGSETPRRAVAMLGLNLLFLAVAVSLWFGIQWVASQR